MGVLKKCILLIAVIVVGSAVGGILKIYQALYELYGD